MDVASKTLAGVPVLRVLIVDDHKLFAEAIRSVLSANGFDVVGVVTNGRQGLEAAERERPDLVLVDLMLPDQSGVDVGKILLERLPETRIVAVTALSDSRPLGEALKAGFHGYLTKDTPMTRFVDAIRAAMKGQIIIPHRVGSASGGARAAEDRDADLLSEQLTERERQVLELLVEGIGGEDMARKLSISPNTVRTHIQNILTKLQVHSRLEAAAFAVRHGLVPRSREHRLS